MKLHWKHIRAGALALLGALMALQVSAEDIDLFTGVNPDGGDPQTVMIGWHSSGNANANVVHGCTYNDGSGAPSMGDTVGGMQQCAIVNAMLAIKNEPDLLGRVKVGLMMFNENGFSSHNNGTGLGNGDSTCGYMVVPPTLMDTGTDGGGNGIGAFISMLKGLQTNNLANQTRLGDMVAEAWAALNGLPNSCSGVDYSSLGSFTECGGAVLLYLGNATKETANVSDGNASPGTFELLGSELTSQFGYSAGSDKYDFFMTPRAVPLLRNSDASVNNNKYSADEWTRFMNLVDVTESARADGNVTTYSIAVYDPALEAKLAGEINFIGEMADVGGGKTFKVQANDAAALSEIIIQVLNEVQDVDSVFSSVSLPVATGQQNTFLNQVFVAMFRPDAQAGPRWTGNVKQYQVGIDAGGNVVLADANQSITNAESAINPNTGTFASNAVSFWTTNAPSNTPQWPAEGFWVNTPSGEGFAHDSPDGALVEKGGAGQMLRADFLTSTEARRVYTCNDTGSCGAAGGLVEFADDNATLLANLGTLIGDGAGAGGGSSMTVGSKSTENLTVSCTGGGNSSCTFSYDGTPALDIFDDKVIIAATASGGGDKINSVCTAAAPCSLTAVTDGSFTVSGKNLSGTYSNATLTRLSKIATITQSNHGRVAGDPLTLEACTVASTADAINSAALTGSVTASVVASLSPSQYNAKLSNYAYAPASANVTCGSAESLLTANNLINWVRGDDIVGNEQQKGPCPPEIRSDSCPISVRGSIHGDVLHSRPVIINYDEAANDQGVVLFYGSNDGHFRAVNGNKSASITVDGVEVRPGGELWSFVAPEFFDKLPRLLRDYPLVDYPGIVDSQAAPEARDYFFDGVTVSLRDSRTEGATAGKKYIFLTARRGGRLIYAFDVTDPAQPIFKWKKTNATLPELGYTWSAPTVALIKHHPDPVLIFGAGYDPAEDADPAPAADSMGRGIIILDAATGDLVWAALPSCGSLSPCVTTPGLTRSIAADISLVNKDSDGFIERLYAADVGGNIWRVDLEAGADLEGATINKLADLGEPGNHSRKFLFRPDVLPLPQAEFDVVVAVSGDREHPLYTDDTTAGLAYNVQNRFYMLMDPNTGKSYTSAAPLITSSSLIDQTTKQCLQSDGQTLGSCETQGATELRFDGSVNSVTFNGTAKDVRGFYFDLLTGEKGVNIPLIVGGSVFFGTNQPDVPAADSCEADLGVARSYKVDLFTGTRSSTIYAGGGMPPSPKAALIDLDGDGAGDKFVCFGCGGGAGDTGSCDASMDVCEPPIPTSTRRVRTHWYFK